MKGQTALVTGASRGLGRAIAVRLAREGAAVCVNFLTSEADADRVVDEIRSAGGRAVAVRTDVGDPAAVRRMVERVGAELSPISILVNNAGLSVRGTLETFESADLERMRRTNVDGLRSEEHTSELQSRENLVCRLLLEKKNHSVTIS